MRQCTLSSRINEKVKKEGQNGNEEIELIDLTMGRGSDRLTSNLFHPGSDRLLPHKGRSIELLNGMETVLQEGDEFLMVPLVAGG